MLDDGGGTSIDGGGVTERIAESIEPLRRAGRLGVPSSSSSFAACDGSVGAGVIDLSVFADDLFDALAAASRASPSVYAPHRSSSSRMPLTIASSSRLQCLMSNQITLPTASQRWVT